MIRLKLILRDYSVQGYSSAGDIWREISRHFTYTGAALGLMTKIGAYPYYRTWRIHRFSDQWGVYIDRLDADALRNRSLRDAILPCTVK